MSEPRIPANDENVDALMALFNHLFLESENTVLVRVGDEPIYLPAGHEGHAHARIGFAHGYFASALHEIAHWCIAGPARRKQVDFGYWYAPDGRDAEQQQAFETLEVQPQAIEWILAKSAGFRYRVSCDNLLGGPFDLQAFKQSIHAEVLRRFQTGLAPRTQCLVDAFLEFYQPGKVLVAADFSLADL
ncbi:hypothetical protein HDN1F_08020 [gamma proteobacterium HdN1]|nr:hypothetical protein HDN1F_08020 [gamma proteobacterium HdN1]